MSGVGPDLAAPGASVMAARQVTITLTSKVVGHYEARSYPDDDYNNDGMWELYSVPVHEILVTGTEDDGTASTYTHQGPRFMPFFNDTAAPEGSYKSRGWINAGLSSKRTIVVPEYKPHYSIHNAYSPYMGAIVLKDAFYIHAGPDTLADIGFGSAGCVEIVGDFSLFKSDIWSLSGTTATDADKAITKLVKARKLIVEIEEATVPDIQSLYTRKIKPLW
jgi:hypothetical protein